MIFSIIKNYIENQLYITKKKINEKKIPMKITTMKIKKIINKKMKIKK